MNPAEHAPPVVYVDPDLEELIPGFLENRRADVERILVAVDAGDLSAVEAIGHSMKGTGGGYGFDYVSEVGARLEALARSGDGHGIRRAVEALAEYMRDVTIRFE